MEVSTNSVWFDEWAKTDCGQKEQKPRCFL